MFDDFICKFLRQFTASPPQNETAWHAPWHAIVNTLFPLSKDYMVAPLRRVPYCHRLVFEVSHLTDPRHLHMRPVLIVEILHGHSQDWLAGIPSLERQINRLIDDAFSGTERRTAISKMYWIGVLGPHWCYGVKEDNGGELKSLIDWHDTTHDQASYDDFQKLTELIAQM